MDQANVRAHLPRSEASLLRRALGTFLRPRMSQADLATQINIEYDTLKDFMRGRANSLPSDDDRNRIHSFIKANLEEIGIAKLEDAEKLPAYKTRNSSRGDRKNASDSMLGYLLEGNLGKIDVAFSKQISIRLCGVYNCYRLLPDAAVRSVLSVYRPSSDQQHFEVIERWKRGDDIVEYKGCAFPNPDFLYWLTIHKTGAMRTFTTLYPRASQNTSFISGILTGRLPESNDKHIPVLSSRIYMEKDLKKSESMGDRPETPRKFQDISSTGPIQHSDIPDHARKIFFGDQSAETFVIESVTLERIKRNSSVA